VHRGADVKQKSARGCRKGDNAAARRRRGERSCSYDCGMRSLRALPKAHLHVHLTACMRRSTLSEVSLQYGLAEYDQVERSECAKFGASYRAARSVLRSPDDLRRLVDEAVCDAGAEGVVWFEPQTTVSRPTPSAPRFE
jgi:hypothetical protein